MAYLLLAFWAYIKCNLVDELLRANENLVDILIARTGLYIQSASSN